MFRQLAGAGIRIPETAPWLHEPVPAIRCTSSRSTCSRHSRNPGPRPSIGSSCISMLWVQWVQRVAARHTSRFVREPNLQDKSGPVTATNPLNPLNPHEDGEVIAADETDRPQFYELLRVPRSASYVAFAMMASSTSGRA